MDPLNLPLVLFPDGIHGCSEPTAELVAKKVGLKTSRAHAIVRPRNRRRGAGGAGGGSLRRFGRIRTTVMIEREAPGGQAGIEFAY